MSYSDYDPSDPSQYAPDSLEVLLKRTEVRRALLLIWRLFIVARSDLFTLFDYWYEYLPEKYRERFARTDLRTLESADLIKRVTARAMVGGMSNLTLMPNSYVDNLPEALEQLKSHKQQYKVRLGTACSYIPGPRLQDFIEEHWLEFGNQTTEMPTDIYLKDREVLASIREYHAELNRLFSSELERSASGFVKPIVLTADEYGQLIRTSVIARFFLTSSIAPGYGVYTVGERTPFPARGFDTTGRIVLKPFELKDATYSAKNIVPVEGGQIGYNRRVSTAGLDTDEVHALLHYAEQVPCSELSFWFADMPVRPNVTFIF